MSDEKLRKYYAHEVVDMRTIYLCSTVDPLIASLRKEIADNAKDAARYRWLRNGNAFFPEEAGIFGGIRGGIELDKAIDVEMANDRD